MAGWLGFEWRVALRFLREGRMQSVLIIVGVAAGVAVIAYVTALIDGLQANTVRKTLGTQAHVALRAPDDVVTPSWPRDDATHTLNWLNGPAAFNGSRESLELSIGPARLTLTPQVINLQLGAIGLTIDASGVHFSGPLVDHQGRVISP